MEERYKLFSENFEAGELSDDEEFFMWWSLLKALEAVGDRLKKAEEEICKLR